MEHLKRGTQELLQTPVGELSVEGPVVPEVLATLEFHPGLLAFRQPSEQKRALVDIADLPEGRIIIARHNQTVIGYVTYLYPDPLERWSEAKLDDLLELGAIEIAAPYRQFGLSKKLLQISFADSFMENYIVISTEYYWHWDLEGTKLSVWDYKEVMKKVMGSVGMEVYATDDPEITCHPANMLMARVGSSVPMESVETFNDVRFRNRYMF